MQQVKAHNHLIVAADVARQHNKPVVVLFLNHQFVLVLHGEVFHHQGTVQVVVAVVGPDGRVICP